MMSWERHIQELEVQAECKCREHQFNSGNYLYQVDDCENAPCSKNCPFKEVSE